MVKRVRPPLAGLGGELEIAILGNRHRMTIIDECPFDPDNERLRA